jgi:serine/threonine protein kinase
MSEPVAIILAVIASIIVGVFAIVFLLVPLMKGIHWLAIHIFRFVVGEVGDVLRIVGSLLTTLFYSFLVVGNIIIGRWSASAHFGRGVGHEFARIGGCIYRIAIGHPAKFLLLGNVTEGIEKRLPEMMAQAPTADQPKGLKGSGTGGGSGGRAGQFEGYKIVGSIAAGGSGGKLYVAEPDAMKLAALGRSGITDVRQVVIKSFSLDEGSSLPQIVRESRSLDAAKKLGLILDHDLNEHRFYYAMRYVPGQNLTLVSKQLHAMGMPEGLGLPELRLAMGYAADLISTLDTYHRGGLWHKDVKPDNIIVDGQRAHLVDFGLVTPLRSAMTLTTHGTEYFRDPEMVRLALRGVKVHEVDGTKFDIYGAGAVLYAMLEDQFPAHGVLSPFSKKSPEALRWIVRRSMAEYDKRYTSAGMMMADLTAVMEARDPYAIKPFELPSMRGAGIGAETNAVSGAPIDAPQGIPAIPGMGAAAGAAGVFGIGAAGAQASPVMPSPIPGAPKITVTNWWTGASTIAPDAVGAAAAGAEREPGFVSVGGISLGRNIAGMKVGVIRGTPRMHEGGVRRAAEQLERAHARVQAARERARARFGHFDRGPRPFRNGMNKGVITALAIVLFGTGLATRKFFIATHSRPVAVASSGNRWETLPPDAPLPPEAPLPPFLAEAESRANRIADAIDRSADVLERNLEEGWNDGPVATQVSTTGAPIHGAELGNDGMKPPKAGSKSGKKGKQPTTPAPIEKVTGNVLVVAEGAVLQSKAIKQRTVALAKKLTDLGVTLKGNWPDLPAAAEAKELVATAIAARAISPLDSPETRESLSDWVRANAKDVDAIVWFAPNPDEPDRPIERLFVPKAKAGETDPNEKMVKAVKKTLRPDAEKR